MAALDDELDDILETLAYVKRRRNSAAPIARLPPEILMYIFQELKAASYQFYLFESGWISVTYVCHSWRTIALECASLWCVLDLGHLTISWAQESLRRSKQAPLTINNLYICDDDDNDSSAYRFLQDLVASRPQQLKALDIFASWSPRAISFLLSSNSRFSSLEALEIQTENSDKVSLSSFSTFFANLRRLTFTRISLTGKVTTPLYNLTSLTFFDAGGNPGPRIPSSVFSSILHNTPALQILNLTDAFPFPADQHTSHNITLPACLSKMTMRCTHRVQDCVDFHNILKISPLTDTNIIIESATVSPSTISDLLAPYSHKPLFAFSILISHNYAVFRFGYLPWSPSEGDAPLPPPPGLNVRIVNVLPLLPELCSSIPLEVVSVLTIEDREKRHMPELRAIVLARARNVRHLRVVDMDAMSLLALLGGGGGGAATAPEAWPSLEILSIVESTDAPGSCDELFLRKPDIFRRRRARGKPIREVRLPERFFPSHVVRKLEHEGIGVKASRAGYY
ncbi:hypothetical protein OF83DRAFT_1170318 [Amylostereum chailletii]|nr:hypothetical protein OF83DRAFT_1170318 [Amylostereum chailletii]